MDGLVSSNRRRNVPMPHEHDDGPMRLSDMQFTDLFISERGEAEIRGHEGEGHLEAIPQDAVADLEGIYLSVCERGQRDDEFFLDYDDVRYRVAKIEEVDGVWYALRRLMWPIPRLIDMNGMHPRVVQALGALAKPGRHGLIVVAGATSQGKTTTACSLLQEYLLHYGNLAVTLEDPVELPLSGKHGAFGRCLQTQIKDGDFSGEMKKTMRRAPRYILLGEIRSAEEADVAIRAANNGHVVITTVHAGGVAEAINTILKLVSGRMDPQLARNMLADGLAAVLHQQLISIKGQSGRMLKLEYLFLGTEPGIRARVRSGKTEMLSTDIDAQASRVMLDKPPGG